MKEIAINSDRYRRGREHNVVWTRVDSSMGDRYAYRIHPHGAKGKKAAMDEAARENSQLRKRAGARESEAEVGTLNMGDRYINENFTVKTHGETDNTRHVVRRRKTKVTILASSS